MLISWLITLSALLMGYGYGGGGDSLIPQRLNLPRSDGNRWTQLGQSGGELGVLWKESNLVSVQTEIGGEHTTQIGGFYSKPAGLASLHAGHLFSAFCRGFFRFSFLSNISFVSLYCIFVFCFFFKVGLELVLQGVTSWGSRETARVSFHSTPIPFQFPLSPGVDSGKRDFKSSSTQWVMTCLTD